MKQLWRESRGNAIGGLIVAAILALISWLSTLYASVGTKPFVIGILVLLWLAYLGYGVYWVSKRRQSGSTPGYTDGHPESQASQADQPQPTNEQPGQYYPCFISYSHKDEEFVQRLYPDLQKHSVRCWYAPEDIKIGDKIRSTIEQSIQAHEKLLLILSEHSINSDWVEKEVGTAFEKERKHNQPVLFPIRLDSAVMETDQAWAADIRRMRHIGDFSQWKNPDAYQRALRRLLRDLKAEGIETDEVNAKEMGSKPSSSPPLPHLLLKVFRMDDRTHRDEVVFNQTRDPSSLNPNRFSFGFALVNTTESTVAKEIDIRVTVFWEGGYQLQTAPFFRTDYYANKGWRAEINELTSNRSAVLTFHGSEQDRCPFGHPLEWYHFKLELKEWVKGSFLVSYQISSGQPETHNQGQLKIVLS